MNKTPDHTISINYLTFPKKKILKNFKSKTSFSVITSKVFKTGKKQLTELNFKRISIILNSSLSKKENFDNKNIYLILGVVQKYLEFLEEFELAVKDIDSIQVLNDKQIFYFTEQAKLEKFLKDGLLDLKGVKH